MASGPRESEKKGRISPTEEAELAANYAQSGGSIVNSRTPASGDFTITNAAGEESFLEVKITEKKEKFRKLSIPRVNNAVRAIQSIGKLSNTYAYKFEAKEVSKIVSHLQKELDDVEARFKRALVRESKSKGFTLD